MVLKIKKGELFRNLELSLRVEPEGFEPSSKQAMKTLSTCLDVVWFSKNNWSTTTYYSLSFFIWNSSRSRNYSMLTLMVPL